eukprot:GHRR01004122.1.p2 GENE.GHRR01004122.1~~GHRR01004122.1.p2  ORF type:complete len:115 (+),score=14.20 GHRR01004122.1:1780-2124(+)
MQLRLCTLGLCLVAAVTMQGVFTVAYSNSQWTVGALAAAAACMLDDAQGHHCRPRHIACTRYSMWRVAPVSSCEAASDANYVGRRASIVDSLRVWARPGMSQKITAVNVAMRGL